MLISYSPEDSSDFYERYYDAQTGFGISVYTGRSVMPTSAMTGNGIGSLFSGLLRKAIPVLKKGAMSVGKRLVSTGVGALSDIAEGKSVKEAARNRFRSAGSDILGDIRENLVGVASSKKRKRKKKTKSVGVRSKKAKTIFD